MLSSSFFLGLDLLQLLLSLFVLLLFLCFESFGFLFFLFLFLLLRGNDFLLGFLAFGLGNGTETALAEWSLLMSEVLLSQEGVALRAVKVVGVIRLAEHVNDLSDNGLFACVAGLSEELLVMHFAIGFVVSLFVGASADRNLTVEADEMLRMPNFAQCDDRPSKDWFFTSTANRLEQSSIIRFAIKLVIQFETGATSQIAVTGLAPPMGWVVGQTTDLDCLSKDGQLALSTNYNLSSLLLFISRLLATRTEGHSFEFLISLSL